MRKQIHIILKSNELYGVRRPITCQKTALWVGLGEGGGEGVVRLL